jgi:large subunit ribosomal protein L18
MTTNKKKIGWGRRRERVRRKVRGDGLRPRLNVYRSERHIYAQIIDDVSGNTIVATSTLSADFKALSLKSWGRDAATRVGELLASKALARDVKAVVFDRNGFLYHGRIKAVADGARSAGLEF